jgi:hypothetical protein
VGAKEAVLAQIGEVPDDIAFIVDAAGRGEQGGVWIIDAGENTPAEQKAMGVARPDDLARVVNAKRSGARGGAVFGQGSDGREGAAAQQEAMGANGIVELTDDLPEVVDVGRNGRPGVAGRIIDRGEDIDGHGLLLLAEGSFSSEHHLDIFRGGQAIRTDLRR